MVMHGGTSQRESNQSPFFLLLISQFCYTCCLYHFPIKWWVISNTCHHHLLVFIWTVLLMKIKLMLSKHKRESKGKKKGKWQQKSLVQCLEKKKRKRKDGQIGSRRLLSTIISFDYLYRYTPPLLFLHFLSFWIIILIILYLLHSTRVRALSFSISTKLHMELQLH